MILVRAADPSDLDVVVVSETSNLGADAWSPGLLAEGVAGRVPYATYLVAEVDGVVVGHAVVSVVVDVAELQRIAVSTTYRRTGVASALLAACTSGAVEGGADRLLVEVREDNSGALSFYAARGFTEVDRRPRYYRDGAAAVVLRLGVGPRCG